MRRGVNRRSWGLSTRTYYLVYKCALDTMEKQRLSKSRKMASYRLRPVLCADVHPAVIARKKAQRAGKGVNAVLRAMNAAEARGEFEAYEALGPMPEEWARSPVKRRAWVDVARNAIALDLSCAVGMPSEERQSRLDDEFEALHALSDQFVVNQKLRLPLRRRSQTGGPLSGRRKILADEARAKGKFEKWMDPTVMVDGCEEMYLSGWSYSSSGVVEAKPLHSLKRRDFLGIATVAPCGHCEMCDLAKKAGLYGALLLESMAGAVVMFWTFTFRRSDGDPKCAEALEAFRLARMSLRKWLRARGVELRQLVAMEPHANGVPHFHAITIGLDPAMFKQLSREGLNEYGCETYLAPYGAGILWPHGRVHGVRVPEIGHPSFERFVRYLGKYCTKGVDASEGMRAAMVLRGDDYDWSKARLVYPRPFLGAPGVPALVDEKEAELSVEGLSAVGFPARPKVRQSIADEMKKRSVVYYPNALLTQFDFVGRHLDDARFVLEHAERECHER